MWWLGATKAFVRSSSMLLLVVAFGLSTSCAIFKPTPAEEFSKCFNARYVEVVTRDGTMSKTDSRVTGLKVSKASVGDARTTAVIKKDIERKLEGTPELDQCSLRQFMVRCERTATGKQIPDYNCPGDPQANETVDGQSNNDSSDMVLVPAGKYWRRLSPEQDGEKQVREVYVSGFYIDVHEVTVAEYRRCIEAGECSAPKKTHSDRRKYNYGASERDKHPINGVTWYQAKVYCSWAGKRLPTEAEWEKAAKGTNDSEYPWGHEEPNCELAVMDEGGDGCGQARTWEVNSKPAGVSPYGAHDMAGNVSEWTADWHDHDVDYYESYPLRDPTGPTRGSYRVTRGGSWLHSGATLSATNRRLYNPAHVHFDLGFRCVSSSP